MWTESSENPAANISNSQPDERCYYKWKMQDESAPKYNAKSGYKAKIIQSTKRGSTQTSSDVVNFCQSLFYPRNSAKPETIGKALEDEEELGMLASRGFLSRGERVPCFGPDGVGWSGFMQRLKHREVEPCHVFS